MYSGEKIDIWSCGIILYIMVTGVAPFQAESPEELLELIRNGQYVQPACIDEGCEDILASTLQVQQNKRPTAAQLLELDWMQGPKEKLVLQHCEFMISRRVNNPAEWIEQFREEVRSCDVMVSEKYQNDQDADGEVSRSP